MQDMDCELRFISDLDVSSVQSHLSEVLGLSRLDAVLLNILVVEDVVEPIALFTFY